MSPPDVATLPFVEKSLYAPDLHEVAKVLQNGLKSTFEAVEVEVVDSPDFTKPPFSLAAEGFNGHTKLIELGGVPYLMPIVNRDKVYDMMEISRFLKRNPAFIAGAGAGPWPYHGANCEGIINLAINNDQVIQGTRTVVIEPTGASKEDGKYKLTQLPNSELRTALLGNYVISDGKPGKVLKVICKKRIGKDNYITAIREALLKHYKENVVGLGGTFLLKEGKAKQHVMADFSKTPLETDEQLNNWLHFFEHRAPLIAVGTLVTGDLDLDLRVQHFHSYSHHGDGGHYHYDTTPDTVHYEGYFVTAKSVIRIDAPVVTHKIGRD